MLAFGSWRWAFGVQRRRPKVACPTGKRSKRLTPDRKRWTQGLSRQIANVQRQPSFPAALSGRSRVLFLVWVGFRRARCPALLQEILRTPLGMHGTMHSQWGPRDSLQQKQAQDAPAALETYEKTVPKMFGISGKKFSRQHLTSNFNTYHLIFCGTIERRRQRKFLYCVFDKR